MNPTQDTQKNQTPDVKVNTLTLKCPDPMLMVRKAMRKLKVGQLMEVSCDDPRTPSDLLKFCEFQDHTHIFTANVTEDGNAHHVILICKGK